MTIDEAFATLAAATYNCDTAPECEKALDRLQAEIFKDATDEPTLEEIARVTGWMIRMRDAVSRAEPTN